ncbi:Eco57I restriction-modification methylase domain-containing protein [Teredinibacter turnerae]|uniref:Eco57I restriction-modification methylase domain-containing protein n=1 Tax=Teredinibacter turnerae TaxID=2426 RepID=UPI0004281DE6|nr:DNA methyltransferase [Teredinibacter turnerae]
MATNKRVANRQHRWLSSVEITGVVLSEPVLADAGNFRSLDKAEIAALRKQREIWNLPKGMVEGNGQPAWINFILEDFLGLKDKDYWQVGAAIPADKVVSLHEQQEVLRPTRVLLDEGNAVMLVMEVPREQSLDKPWLQEKGRWKASPTTKFERLLRETGVELGLLTNGEAWRLVVASPSETTSWMTWTVQTWNDDPITLAAFKDLLGESRFFAGPRDQVILELIKQSRQRQLDVADQLGNQVREALQILVHELDRTDAELGGHYLQGYSEAEVFESSVAFIMRLLFTLYAEENGLLPHGNVTYDRAYGVLHLLTELEETRRLAPGKLKHSYAAYARLLASARLLHDGSIDPDIRIAAHGGQLFDPDRYPLLDGRAKNGDWPVEVPEPPKVRDAVIRDILRSLKYAKADGVRQLVSYRTLAVEQIGHMYEGLLDRRVARAPTNQTLLMLQGGSKIKEPEPISAHEFSGLDQKALIKVINKHTSKTAGTIKKVLERNEERQTLVNLGTDDAELLEEAKPVERFLQPLGIVRPGGLYVTHGQDRRSSGAHYTPPTLTEPVVRRTLEHQVYVNVVGKPGLLVEPRLIKTPKEILGLKVCDPAMGSGAFLVQATRYLAERLVDAWERMAAEQPDSILTMPFGTPSQGEASENLMPESREERIVFARRYVAERCIYGVDMNRLAVEMAKLSLWLTTLSTDRPFTFVDHALKHGNSLVGLTPEQIRNFTWKPVSNDFGPLFANQPDQEVEEAEKHREAIHNIADHDFVSKEKENRIAEEALASIRIKAILAIAAFFDGANTKQREAKLIEYRYWLERLGKDEKAQVEIDKIVRGLTTGEKPIIPFCWEVEFPEVFHRDNGGFDAFVGNPPFAGKNTTSQGSKPFFLDWLKLLHDGTHGNADLVAHFFRRAFTLLSPKGSFGLIATKTIAQGDTRNTGLTPILKQRGIIYSADKRVNWPGKASVIVSLIFIAKSNYSGKIILDSKYVDFITSYLFKKGQSEDPFKLSSNLNKAGQGTIPLGMGFTFDETEKNSSASPISLMHELVKKDKRNKSLILPYIGGHEVNSTPTHANHRYIINFSDMSEDEAMMWPDLYAIAKEKVYPERQKSNRDNYKKYWWQFGEKRPGLYRSLEGLKMVLVCTQTSKYRTFTFLPNGMIYDQKLIVFAIESMRDFCVMQSRLHEEWSLFFGSTMKDDPVYTPTDCFETFPFPLYMNNEQILQCSGEDYFNFRKDLMISTGDGLTKTYNKFHDPDENSSEIIKLRELHQKLDEAALKAYGWDDLELSYVFEVEYEVEEGKSIPWRYRWPDELRDEVLGRLLALNKERHLE